jgi:hypothetical protein
MWRGEADAMQLVDVEGRAPSRLPGMFSGRRGRLLPPLFSSPKLVELRSLPPFDDRSEFQPPRFLLRMNVPSLLRRGITDAARAQLSFLGATEAASAFPPQPLSLSRIAACPPSLRRQNPTRDHRFKQSLLGIVESYQRKAYAFAIKAMETRRIFHRNRTRLGEQSFDQRD